MTGQNRVCAAYSGIRDSRYTSVSMILSGGIHALAGIFIVLGSGGERSRE